MKKSPEEIAEDFIYKGYAVKDLQSWLTDPACVARGISVLIRAERYQAPQHFPASFINQISETGTKEEAVQYLQEIWNELQSLKKSHPSSRPDERDELILKQREALRKTRISLELMRIIPVVTDFENGKIFPADEFASMREIVGGTCLDVDTSKKLIEKLLALPLPASTKKMEAMLRVCELAETVTEGKNAMVPEWIDRLRKAVKDVRAITE